MLDLKRLFFGLNPSKTVESCRVFCPRKTAETGQTCRALGGRIVWCSDQWYLNIPPEKVLDSRTPMPTVCRSWKMCPRCVIGAGPAGLTTLKQLQAELGRSMIVMILPTLGSCNSCDQPARLGVPFRAAARHCFWAGPQKDSTSHNHQVANPCILELGTRWDTERSI